MSEVLGVQKQNTTIQTEKQVETTVAPKRTPHKVYGDWIEVIVHPSASQDKNTDIWVGVNDFGAQFKPRENVWLPKGIVKLLKDPNFAGTVEHYFDAEAISEISGKRGVHKSRMLPKYVVELVTNLE